MNLTAVKDADEVMERHVEDSLAILLPLRDCYRTRYGDTPSHEKLSLVDIGTGAGLPRVVLAIACPEWEVTLIESMNKRCVFLEHVVGIIGSSNIQIVRGRTESATKKIEILQKKLNEAQMTIQMKRKEAKDQIERHTKAEWAICLCNSRVMLIFQSIMMPYILFIYLFGLNSTLICFWYINIDMFILLLINNSLKIKPTKVNFYSY
ncbi:Ribosomal RNA small subunit methyltransferase G [Arachis hypogaea]|nr:Ribosomal RNA small subunit methyltransferase G [Arachis hypogaea]